MPSTWRWIWNQTEDLFGINTQGLYMWLAWFHDPLLTWRFLYKALAAISTITLYPMPYIMVTSRNWEYLEYWMDDVPTNYCQQLLTCNEQCMKNMEYTLQSWQYLNFFVFWLCFTVRPYVIPGTMGVSRADIRHYKSSHWTCITYIPADLHRIYDSVCYCHHPYFPTAPAFQECIDGL